MDAYSLVSSGCSLREKRFSTWRSLLRTVLLSAAVGVSALMVGQSSRAQALFIGDAGANPNSVKQFDASGTYNGVFGTSGAAGLNGPRGMIFSNGQLFVVNQNVNTQYNGEVLRFDANGTLLGQLVSTSNQYPLFAPRGIVRGGPDNLYYVADVVGPSSPCAAGNVKEYDDNGEFQGSLTPDPQVFTDVFHPRGVVFGPDGLLYVSSSGCLDTPKDPLFNPVTGYILRFNVSTGKFVDVFASNKTVGDLHRPEGLVFDSAGNLWVTSFRNPSAPGDTDKILKLDKKGHLRDELLLSKPRAPRAYAEAIVFGPGGNLFIPITGNDATTAGELRSCSPETLKCTAIVPTNASGGPLVGPWYVIFKNSDPATLNYNGD